TRAARMPSGSPRASRPNAGPQAALPTKGEKAREIGKCDGSRPKRRDELEHDFLKLRFAAADTALPRHQHRFDGPGVAALRAMRPDDRRRLLLLLLLYRHFLRFPSIFDRNLHGRYVRQTP